MSSSESRLDLRPDHLTLVQDILRKHVPSRKVLAFGSRATWTAKEYSDLDLAILGEEPLSLHTISVLAEDFRDSDLPFKVDVVDWTRVDGPFRNIIQLDNVVVQLATGDDWQTKTLGEAVTLQRGFDLPVAKRTLGSYPVIASTGPVGTHNEAAVEGPGVVIGRSGSLGGGQYIKEDFWPLNTTLWVKDFKQNEPRFCYFLLKSLNLGQYNAGSGVPTLNRNHIHPLLVSIPPPPEQRAIAHILGTLDDKIELNQKMNQTLEKIAKAIFKSWFVDFDPVRAKAEGRPTGLPSEVSDLFPDKLVKSEIGKIPKGWEISDLKSVSTNRSKSVKPDEMSAFSCYVGLEHLPRGHIFLFEWGNPEKVKSNKTIFEAGDVLFGKLRPYFEKSIVTQQDGICSTDIVVINPEEHAQMYTACMVSQKQFFDFTSQGSTGTRMPRTSWKHMCEYKFALPSEELLQCFQTTALPMFQRGFVCISENQTLSEIRDTLLPKLISGELPIPDAEKFLEEADI